MMTLYKQLQLEGQSADIVLHTNQGDIGVILFKDEAPLAVKNFKDLAKQGYYNGIVFHRVIKDFMIQGGDPSGTGRGGESIYGESFADEFTDNLFNLRGALSMANAGPNTNGSQFFIVTASSVPQSMLDQMEPAGYPNDIIDAYRENGGTPWLDQRHTVFGHVVEGMGTVETIEQQAVNSMDKPLEDVLIESITVHD